MLRYIRNVNDIHIDFDVDLWRRYPSAFPVKWWTPPHLDTDKETVLVIAGDIGNGKLNVGDWFVEIAQRFYAVVYVDGNHDQWGTTLSSTHTLDYVRSKGVMNVHRLQNSYVMLDGVRFMGGTLWTNFNKEDPLSLYNHKIEMGNDLNMIQLGPHAMMSTIRMLIEHRQTRDFIFQNAARRAGERALVVVTHHAPSEMSIGKDRDRTPLKNTYYYSEYGNEISYSEIDFWFHGHTHNSVDYMIYNTRVMNNPRGYAPNHMNPEFNPFSIVELPD